MFKTICFKNYKCFEERQTLKIKPITVLIGKNSGGKSAVARLPLLLFQSLFETSKSKPIELTTEGIVFGESFEDILYNKYSTRELEFEVELIDNENNITVNTKIQNIPELKKQIISNWSCKSFFDNKEENINLRWDGNDKTVGYIETTLFEEENKTAQPINFKGFIPITRKKTIQQFSRIIGDSRFDINYLAAIRASAESFYSKDTPLSLNDGSYIPGLLYKDNLLRQKVSNWFEKKLEGWRLETENIKGDYFELLLSHQSNPSVKINITQTGLGFSQVMPVIAAAYMIKSGDLFIIEEPEQHLHPAVHGSVAELLAVQAKKENASFLIETHSKNFILRLRRLIAEGQLNSDDVVIYWIDNDEENGKSCLKEITIDAEGMLSDWPEGVFSEDLDEIFAIRQAQRKKETK